MNNKIIRFVSISKRLLFSLGGIVAFFGIYSLLGSCSNDSPTDIPPLEAPHLVESTPVNGAEEIPAGNLTIVLTYDQRVTVLSDAREKITMDGAIISDISVSLTKVNIQVSGLVKGRKYELVVPQGIVLGPTGIEAPGLSLSLNTVKENGEDSGSGKLCTPNPLPQAKKVYEYLVSIYGKKTLSGAMANVNWNINESTWVYKHTGKWPAINGFDFLHFFTSSPGNWIDYENTEVVEKWWNDGGLVAAMWHWNVLANDGVSYTCTPGSEKDAEHTSFDVSKIDDVNSDEYKQLIKDLDKVAGYLKLLRDKNIPVLWRPLHEAAGNYYHTEWNGTAWFWWGYHGPEPFKKLWHLMYDRFVNLHNLNNLIWIWTYEDHNEWYPGDGYVDIIGSDIYKQTAIDYFSSRYTAMNKDYSSKLAVMAECGGVSKISDQWTSGAKWAYFMPWYDYDRTKDITSPDFNSKLHEHADVEWWKDALNQDFVITREQLPSMK